MKPPNGELQFNIWDEPRIDANEEQKLIESLRWNDEQIANRQSWYFRHINTIKNFITLKNNSFRVKGPFFKMDWKKDGIKW